MERANHITTFEMLLKDAKDPKTQQELHANEGELLNRAFRVSRLPEHLKIEIYKRIMEELKH